MASNQQNFPSFASVVCAMSIVFYCIGFLRVELELNKFKKRIHSLESASRNLQRTSEASYAPTTTNFPDRELKLFRLKRRHVDSTQSPCMLCSPGPPGLPGAKGEKGSRGRRGNQGDQGIMGSPGRSGKQGIMGPRGIIGQKGQKGDVGPLGMPGAKGEPGESISAPAVAVSPAKLTVNEGSSASFQCSVTGNPEPAVTWSRVNSQSVLSQSAVSGGMFRLRNVKGSDAGIYRCSATNILGNAKEDSQLVVNVHPTVSIHPGPLHAIEGSNVTLPTCNVSGHPTPHVTWKKTFGQLPQGRVESNKSVLTLFDVQKKDSADYVCTATNMLGKAVQRTLLVVVSLPQFTVKPPAKVVGSIGANMTLNCSATGDPQPVISWKRQGSQLLVGRSQQIDGALVIRDVQKEDEGNYICVATSAGVFVRETGALVEVRSPKDCSDVLKSGQTHSGVYSIDPDGKGSFDVYCDMRTDGGGWTVFQRRQDGSVDFYRGWNDYKSGFGQLMAEFWLGNDKIHRLTASRASSLRVELEDWNGVKVYAKYGRFNIGDEQAKYRLEVSSYSGTAGGDSLAYHNNMAFTTKDRDHDRYRRANCAVSFISAWWYNRCQYSNLNGKYLGNKQDKRGIRWNGFRGNLSLKFIEMKLRPSS